MVAQYAPIAPRVSRIASVKRNTAKGLTFLSSLTMSFLVTVGSSKVIIRKLLDIPLTVIGLVCINIGFFQIIHSWGWITSGVSLIILEAMIADKDDV